VKKLNQKVEVLSMFKSINPKKRPKKEMEVMNNAMENINFLLSWSFLYRNKRYDAIKKTKMKTANQW